MLNSRTLSSIVVLFPKFCQDGSDVLRHLVIHDSWTNLKKLGECVSGRETRRLDSAYRLYPASTPQTPTRRLSVVERKTRSFHGVDVVTFLRRRRYFHRETSARRFRSNELPLLGIKYTSCFSLRGKGRKSRGKI